MYKTNTIYVWQNQVGDHAYLNGTECTVTGGKERFLAAQDNDWHEGWPTDTEIPNPLWGVCYALAGDLREKDMPSGERMICDMFIPRKLLTMS